MAHLSLDAKGGQWLADLAEWGRSGAPDNRRQLEQLRQKLRTARRQVLTPRQREILGLYYDEGLTMSQIGERLGLNRSTVCRTIHRARSGCTARCASCCRKICTFACGTGKKPI